VSGPLADHAEDAHGSRRLDEHDPVEDEIPQRERPPEVRLVSRAPPVALLTLIAGPSSRPRP